MKKFNRAFTHYFAADPDSNNEKEMKTNREIFIYILDKVKNVSDIIEYIVKMKNKEQKILK